MLTVDLLGWLGTITGTILGLPQAVRLIRIRQVAGLSLPAWQAMLVTNLGWTAHGVAIGQPPQIITSALSLCATLPILYLLGKALTRSTALVLLPGLIGAAAVIGVDKALGSAVFGATMIIPAVLANGGQTPELIRAPSLAGVSPQFLILGVINQVLWFSWAIRVPDTGTMIITIVTGLITTFSLAWWLLRKPGLITPFGTPPAPVGPAPETTLGSTHRCAGP